MKQFTIKQKKFLTYLYIIGIIDDDDFYFLCEILYEKNGLHNHKKK